MATTPWDQLGRTDGDLGDRDSSDDDINSDLAGASSDDGEEDRVYGLASVLYHALQGVSASRKYEADARRAGVYELIDFFGECKREATERAKHAKELLVAYSEPSEDAESEDGRD